MSGTALAVLGTGSDVGKSVLTAAFCRIFANRGVDVAPYKAQNMSNNAFVTALGGEIGRAQLVQAVAARKVPHTDHNPVLLKPNTELGSQVVIHGQVVGDLSARGWWKEMGRLQTEAYVALDRLIARHELVVMEGAGSCAEVNLRPRDYVNFEAAHHVGAPVVLVADIDRGGVFGQVVGTLACLDERDRAAVAGVVINRFRGDVSLFQDGVGWLEEKTGVPVLGVVPWFRGFRVEDEDAVPLDAMRDPSGAADPSKVRVAVLRLPHISNFTDLQPLSERGDVELHWLTRARDLSGYDLLVLPGSKNVRRDLAWVRAEWGSRIAAFSGTVLGLCGGFQMLGESIADPHGVEGPTGTTDGLGLLELSTTLAAEKTLSQVSGDWDGVEVRGYEIHMGVTEGADWPVHRQGRVLGSYVHGLLDLPQACNRVLAAARPDVELEAGTSMDAAREDALERLAEHVAAVVDVERLAGIAGLQVLAPIGRTRRPLRTHP
ncbi:MAG: cobyric acid synthase [Proteobacteria bacterium]|nr:cobyric acid synthase [Pseudomonadota bacterium]MCP4915619.1 cobyric acid synthase [Pseudomonadota bacterium]